MGLILQPYECKYSAHIWYPSFVYVDDMILTITLKLLSRFLWLLSTQNSPWMTWGWPSPFPWYACLLWPYRAVSQAEQVHLWYPCTDLHVGLDSKSLSSLPSPVPKLSSHDGEPFCNSSIYRSVIGSLQNIYLSEDLSLRVPLIKSVSSLHKNSSFIKLFSFILSFVV